MPSADVGATTGGAVGSVRRLPVIDAALRAALLSCWTEVTNAGGAVGFAAPVTPADVAPELDRLADRVAAGEEVLCVLVVDDEVAGFATIARNRNPLTAHWATVYKVQVHPRRQGSGLGRTLMLGVHDIARAEGLEMLQLSVRGGTGREDFYTALGYREWGRLPGEVRVAPGDDREGIYLRLELRPA